MPADLDTLSREIAATSSKWATAGVRVFLDGDRSRPVRLMSAEWMVVEDTWRRLRFELTADDRPDLNDAVTVNSLLGDRFISDRRFSSDIGDYHWCGPVDAKGNGEIGPTRTTAICRAWIAAHKGDK